MVGAAGEGIDGLQFVCPQAVFNDFSRVAGDQVQAQGRISRPLNGTKPVFEARSVVSSYMMLDDPEEMKRYDLMMARLHTHQFVRENRTLVDIDSETAQVAAAARRARFREQMKNLGLNVKPSRADEELVERIRADDEEYRRTAEVQRPLQELSAQAKVQQLLEEIRSLGPNAELER